MRLSALQINVSKDETPLARVERVVAQVEHLAPNCDFITLPELWETGAFDLKLGLEQATTLEELSTGGWLSALKRIAADNDTWIHAGSFMERGVGVDEGKTFNTSVMIDNQGNIAATYRKIHLFGFDGGEAVLLDAGSELVVVDTPLGKTGLATCYDIRFPELFRKLLDRGVEALIVPTGWPLSRIWTWTTLAQARAIENQLWLIGTNEVGNQDNNDGRFIELGGNTVIASPAGKVVALGGEGEEVITVEIDPSETGQIRERFPILRDRVL